MSRPLDGSLGIARLLKLPAITPTTVVIHKESEKNKAGRSSQKAPFPPSPPVIIFSRAFPGASASQTVPKVNEAEGGTRTNEDEATKATGCFFPIPSPPIVESTKLISRDRALVGVKSANDGVAAVRQHQLKREREIPLEMPV